MINTPRTDSARRDEHDPYMAIASECSKLERELNAANDRIKRLEDAGDALKAAGYFGGFGGAVNKWNKAKEAKL